MSAVSDQIASNQIFKDLRNKTSDQRKLIRCPASKAVRTEFQPATL